MMMVTDFGRRSSTPNGSSPVDRVRYTTRARARASMVVLANPNTRPKVYGTLDSTSALSISERLISRVLNATFRLVSGSERPAIEVAKSDGQSWLV
jgi:hypothetical protein